jgi:hypothetical protein
MCSGVTNGKSTTTAASNNNNNDDNHDKAKSETAVTTIANAGAAAATAATTSAGVTLTTGSSPQELVTKLLSCHDGNYDKVIAMLQHATDIAMKQKMQRPQQPSGGTTANAAAAVSAVDLGNPLSQEPVETSLITPRLGKFSFQFYEHGLKAIKEKKIKLPSDGSTTTVTVEMIIESTNITHIIVFPKPEDCKLLSQSPSLTETTRKKLTGNLVLLRLRENVVIENKSTKQICFALPSDKKTGPIGPSTVDNDDTTDSDVTDQWCQVLQQSLLSKNTNIDNDNVSFARVQPNGSSGYCFKSYQPPSTSTTTGGMPFVNCYMGVNDGVLYPLPEGLLFYKPPRFIPRSTLYSIACGRGSSGGQQSSRYVDMIVQLQKNEVDDDDDDQKQEPACIEFTNIQREENGELNSYIHNILIPAMQKDAERSEERKGKKRSGDDDGQEEEEAVVAEAVVDDDEATEEEDIANVNLEDSEEEEVENDSDEVDEDFHEDSEDEEEENGSDDEEDDDDDDDGFEVVRDEFAASLAKEKRKKNQDDGSSSATESDDNDDESKPRTSKRLRK